MSNSMEDMLELDRTITIEEPTDDEDTKDDIEDEAKRITKEVENAIDEVRVSEFYAGLCRKIRTFKKFNKYLKRALGESHSHIQVVVYALGSMEFCFISQYQIAIIIALARDFPTWILPEIEVYDPAFSPADRIALKNLGCNVLSTNEHCSRQVKRPTLFYMPYAETNMIANVLAANWCASRINQIVILMRDMHLRIKSSKYSLTNIRDHESERRQYFWAIKDYVKYVYINEKLGTTNPAAFEGFAWHFFQVIPETDKDPLKLPDKPSPVERLKWYEEWTKEQPDHDYLHLKKCSEEYFMELFEDKLDYLDCYLQEQSDSCRHWPYRSYGEGEMSRRPRKYRCKSIHHPKGWIKINFSGKKLCDDIKSTVGFGIVIYNDKKEIMQKLSGILDQGDDEIEANLEALKKALNWLKSSTFSSTSSSSTDEIKLIIEGDNIRVMRWINSHGAVPEKYRESLVEVLILMKNFRCMVYHIYEEANSPAIETIYSSIQDFTHIDIASLTLVEEPYNDLENKHKVTVPINHTEAACSQQLLKSDEEWPELPRRR
ncbi:hypothetical protein ACFE04_027101 [Oxalis oulophora]